jgi:hypothetical protein
MVACHRTAPDISCQSFIAQCTLVDHRGPLSSLDNSLDSKVSRPRNPLQKIPRRCLLDLCNIGILMRRIGFMEVC